MNLHRIFSVTRRSDIIATRSGRIDITRRVADLLDLRRGDVVSLLADADDLYLFVASRAEDIVGRHEAQCHPTSANPRSRHFRAWSRTLAAVMLDACGSGLKRVALAAGMPVQADGRTIIPLITKHPLSHA